MTLLQHPVPAQDVCWPTQRLGFCCQSPMLTFTSSAMPHGLYYIQGNGRFVILCWLKPQPVLWGFFDLCQPCRKVEQGQGVGETGWGEGIMGMGRLWELKDPSCIASAGSYPVRQKPLYLFSLLGLALANMLV